MCPADLPPTAGEGLRISSVWSFAALGRPAEAGCDARDVAELRRSGLFDVAHYLASGPDPGGDPHLHYLHDGWRKGRQPNPYFDPAWYIASTPELCTGECLDPVFHYVLVGALRRADPGPWFDTQAYLAAHPAAADSGLSPLGHALRSGAPEVQQEVRG